MFPDGGRLSTSSILVWTCLMTTLCSSLMHTLSQVSQEKPIPQVVFLRRQVRHLGHQRRTITLVYHSRHVAEGGVESRWFRPAPNHNLPYAELQNMLPTEGDDNFEVTSISAGNVVATTLLIKQARIKSYPVEYSLIVKVHKHPMQFLVTTRLTREVGHVVDILDGIRWLHVPEAKISFGYRGRFTVTCRAEIDSESRGFLDELHMYRTYLELEDRKATRGHLVSVSVGAIHRDRDNYVEESGKYRSTGRRLVQHRIGIAEFELEFSVMNATREDEGMFTCAMERYHDKSFVSAWVRQGALNSKPLIEFIPCEAHSFAKAKSALIAEQEKETCFRCRGIGQPLPDIWLYREGKRVKPSRKILIDTHVNVADGGLAEVTYTFLKPTSVNNGLYECRVTNRKGSASFTFNFVIA